MKQKDPNKLNIKKQGLYNNITNKNKSKFHNKNIANTNNKNKVKKSPNKLCVKVCKKDIGDSKHIFMQKIDNEGKVTDGYHFIFFEGQEQPTIYHTCDGHKYFQIDEEQKMLIEKVFEYYKLANKAKLLDYDHDNISRFFRYLLFVKLFNMEQAKIIKKIYDNSEKLLLFLPNPKKELVQHKIDKKKVEIFKQQLELADKQTNEDNFVNDDYLKNLLILNAKANEIKLQEQAVQKQIQQYTERKKEELKNTSKAAIEKERKRLRQILFPENPNQLHTIKTNDITIPNNFNSLFSNSNVLSINVSRGKLVNNTRPLSADLKIYDKNQNAICSFTIQKCAKNAYEITLTLGDMKYTQFIGAKAIDEEVFKLDNTKQTLENITELFYNKLSSYFGVNIQSKRNTIPSVFNVKGIELIDIEHNVTKHQQGYVDKHNTYQLIYEAHPKMCNCNKHYFGQGATGNATKDLVLYYGGENDEGERDEKENIFNNYCKNIKDFKKLENEVGVLSSLSSLFGMNKDKNIHNANAYGKKNESDKWRRQHPNWQSRVKTNKSPLTTIQEEKQENLQTEQNFFKKITNNESEQKGFFDYLCCIKGKDSQESNEMIILDDSHNDINADDPENIPIKIKGKSMFAFAKEEETKPVCNLLSCCMKTNQNEKENEINIIDTNIYEEIPININNAKSNNNNIIKNNILDKE